MNTIDKSTFVRRATDQREKAKRRRARQRERNKELWAYTGDRMIQAKKGRMK